MSHFEALALSDSPLPKIKVHATVIFSILNSFVRRNTRDARVIGTLLGEIKDGVVVISDCFAVPFTEKTDELYVAINQDYHKSMYAFHRRNNKKEFIVGWYTTTTVNGEFIIDNSSLIHDFYSTEVENPVHLVIDTTLLGDNISARGFVVNQMVVGEDTLANTFQEAKVDLELSEAETTVLYTMIHGQDAASKWSSSEISTTIPSSTQRLEGAVTDLSKVFDDVQAYVDNVVDGKIAPSREVGIAIAEALNSFATQNAQSAAQQNSVQTKVQDLLMISFLSTLTQTQTLISEKLLEIV